MLVELGNASPVGPGTDDGRPGITYLRIPENYTFKRDVDAEHWRSHLTKAVMRGGGIVVPEYEGGEALAIMTHPAGPVSHHQDDAPTWVWSDDADAARFLSDYHQCPIAGSPDGGHGDLVDETHWRFGPGKRLLAPGVSHNAMLHMNALLTNVGATSLADVYGGGVLGLTGTYGKTGTGSSATSTSLVVTASSLTLNAWIGAVLLATDTTNGIIMWGNVSANGTGSFTVDQWYTPAGAQASPTSPAAGFEYFVSFTSPPAYFMGITTSSITPGATDTSLTGEATANGMGRKVAAYGTSSAVSGGSITWTNSAAFTYGTTGLLTFTALGMFISGVKTDTTDTMVFETNLAGSFSVSNNGDIATVTDTITGN